MTNLTYSQVKPNEQKIRFLRIALVFFWFLLILVIFNEILIFLEILRNILYTYGIELWHTLTKTAILSFDYWFYDFDATSFHNLFLIFGYFFHYFGSLWSL